ncbi:MAG TPA: MG2 domain-containing protein, partial [Terriglobales bacterium]|nr:MG2 domain-containing protein [Terriglobales bacterium]
RKSAVVKLEIVAPTGHQVASSTFAAQLKTGTNKLSTQVSLPELPKKSEDLLWYRLTYSVAANGAELAHGTLPLFESVQDFTLHVSAPALLQPGKKFFLRIHTSHPVLGRAIGSVAIKAQVHESDAETPLASAAGTTDANGYTVLSMSLPADLQARDLEVAVQAQRGTVKKTAENDLKVGAPSRILVQTDKPLYQPGQTLHIRALVFGDEHRAISTKKIYLQVEDEDGTVVFRDEHTSSRFGVVATDWTIPDRIRLGSYRILAKTYPGQYVDTDDDSDDEDNPMTAAADRKLVRISRYELPTFVVNAKPDRMYYLPEQKASVEISAAYLFGKPVPKASVKIAQLEERTWNFSKQKWEVEESEPISGTTDDQGTFRATLDLSKERSDLDEYSYRKFRDVTYTAYVTDPSTGRTEERRFDVRVTKYPIHVYYVPQNSSRSGLPEEFFISTSYADGSPAQCEVEVRTVALDGSGERILASVNTSRYGVARVSNPKPAFANEGKELPLILVARDRKGATGLSKENLWPERNQHFLRVVTKKTILAPEEPIEAEIRSDSDGEIVVELANQSKVLRSFTVRLRHHWAMVKIPYSSEFVGQLALAAINMEHAGGHWGGYGTSASRSVIYPQNRDLKIAVHLNQSEYRPGEDAAATVQVRTSSGSAIPSVIGAVIFDKAVEERARIDEDLRDSFGFGGYGGWWYQGEAKLASLTRADLDRVDTNEQIPEDLDIAADFLLNAFSNGWGNYSPVFGDDYDSESPRDVYKGDIDRILQPLLSALDEELKDSGTLPRNRQELDALLQRHHLIWSELKDPWSSEFIPTFSIGRNDYELQVFSPGPDKQLGTDDDFTVANRSVSFYAATERHVTRALEEYHRKNGGFVRDLSSLRTALSAVSVDMSKLIDPWGHPYIFEFGINGAQFTVTAKTRGEAEKPGEEYVVGTSAIDYFAETRAAIDRILRSKIQAAGKTPDTPEEFKALLLPEVPLDNLHDPYGRPYLVRTVAVARYSDRWVQHNQQVKTEPIIVWNRLIKIRSMGADGLADTDDDFDVASFAAVLSEVTVTGKTSTPTVHVLFTGNTGGISGVISDPSGAVVPNTKVVAINANTNAEYETTTDSNGSYLLLDLPPGVYDVSVQATGFIKTTLSGIIVRGQEALEVNATLQVAAATQTVEVTAETQQLRTESAMVSTVNKPPTTDLAQRATVTPRLREYFPETLLWLPSVETDANGRARIRWKFADNLTTWKLSLIASTLDGRLATIDKEVKSFQPFFVEHDPPKVLTLGDRISLPVVIRNYTDRSERVKVEMPSAGWFQSRSTAIQEVSLSPGGNSRVIFPFEAVATTATGKQRVIASGSSVADAIERSVTVHPDGAELTQTDGRIVSGRTTWDFDIPAEVIPGSVHADLKIYPDLLAHVTEALEGMLERPWGCGEQTISSTYSSVLLLKFEKERKRSLGPLHDRAMRYVALGYTRLLTYIDDSGAVTYWGRGEPDLALTAYAVRFLHDASEFKPIDAGVLARARHWLFQQQKADGGWVEHHWYTSSPVEDAILTSYITRILASTQPLDPNDKNLAVEEVAIGRALNNVAIATNNFTDPYLFASFGLAEMAAGHPKWAE